MDRGCGRTEPDPCSRLCDAHVLRAAEVQHPVQNIGGDSYLGRLSPLRLRTPYPKDWTFQEVAVPASGGGNTPKPVISAADQIYSIFRCNPAESWPGCRRNKGFAGRSIPSAAQRR